MVKCDAKGNCDGFNWRAKGELHEGRLKQKCDPKEGGKKHKTQDGYPDFYEKCTPNNTLCDV